MSCSLDIPEEENLIRWITGIEIPLGESVNLGSLSDDSVSLSGLSINTLTKNQWMIQCFISSNRD